VDFTLFCLHTAARNIAVKAYTVNKIFHRNVYNIKNIITLGDIIIAVVYPNTQCNEGLLYIIDKPVHV
jgi:hypothetical protein